MGLSREQRDVLGRYLDQFQDGDPDTRDPVKLPLVLTGKKPGTIIRPRPWEEGVGGDIIDFFACLGLARGQIPPSSAYYVSRDRQLINSLPNEVCDEPEYHRTLGRFFGYPDDAVDFFVEQDLVDRTQPEDLIAEGMFDVEKLAFTDFVSYIPVDSIEGYKQAITDGKTNYRHLLEVADYWDLPAIEAIADSIYHNCVDRLSVVQS